MKKEKVNRLRRIEVPDKLLMSFGKITDREMAEKLGCSLLTARAKRIKLGIPPKNRKLDWERIILRVKSGVPVSEIARDLGYESKEDKQIIYNYLRRKGIPFSRIREARGRPTREQIRLVKDNPRTRPDRLADLLGTDEITVRYWRKRKYI